MWIEYNPNPCGRVVGDCSVRAIATALDIDWETAYMMLCDAGLAMCDMPSSNQVISAVLRQNGFYRENIPSTRVDTYTAKDFCRDNPIGTYILGFGTHVAVVINGNLIDAWNSSFECPQYFWTK